MAEKEPEKSAADQPEPQAKKGKGRLIIIIAVVIFLLGGAGGGFYYWRSTSVAAAENAKNKKSQSKSETPIEKDEADKKAAKKGASAADALENAIPDDQEVKKIIELPPFIVNLADTEQSRYLRMTISLGVNESEKSGDDNIGRHRNKMLPVICIALFVVLPAIMHQKYSNCRDAKIF